MPQLSQAQVEKTKPGTRFCIGSAGFQPSLRTGDQLALTNPRQCFVSDAVDTRPKILDSKEGYQSRSVNTNRTSLKPCMSQLNLNSFFERALTCLMCFVL